MMPRITQTTLLTVLVLLAAGAASAQTAQPAPQQGFQPPPQQQAQEPPCFKEFSALRGEAEKRGKALQEASKRKVAPPEACKLFTGLVSAETKLIKYVEENATWCGIPPQVTKQLKEQHVKVLEVRTRVCQAAARPAPASPTLSDALGTNRIPTADNIKSGRGTFDTLTGTPLGQK
jgi:hypothetical protein